MIPPLFPLQLKLVVFLVPGWVLLLNQVLRLVVFAGVALPMMVIVIIVVVLVMWLSNPLQTCLKR